MSARWLALALALAGRLAAGSEAALPVSPVPLVPRAGPEVHPGGLPTLTNVASLHRLSAKEAERRYPVHLKGILTYHDRSSWTTTFIQDETGGVYLEGGGRDIPVEFGDERQRAGGLRPGQRVEVTGFSDPGGFAPFVVEPRIRVLGPGLLPEPAPIAFDDLVAGQQDGSWVELEGIVRAVRDPSLALPEGKHHVQLDVAEKGHRFRVWLPNWDEPLPVEWTDARVRLGGVCGATTTKQNQLLGVELLVPERSAIQVIEPAPQDPFGKAARPVSGLLKYSLELTNEHRIKVRGVVLHHRRGQDLFVRDETASLRVITTQTNQVNPGDVVDVAGFARSGLSGPVLEGAVFRRMEAGPSPIPRRLAGTELLGGAREAELVQLEGRLISRGREPGKDVLMLQSSDLIFSAELDHNAAAGPTQLPEPGSLLQLTGIQLLELEDLFKTPRTFRLLLRSPGDIAVLKRAPWWNTGRAFAAVAALGIGLLGALLWIKMLRRRVEQRTRELSGEIEERKRMELEVQGIHKQLMLAAHQAGMAEVATGVLHDVGNVLNSVNVSAELLARRTRQSRTANLPKLADLLIDHAQEPSFLTADERGREIPGYLKRLSEHIASEQENNLSELGLLRQNIEHINEIVAMQQNYARVVGLAEPGKASELVEDAIRLNNAELTRRGFNLVRSYGPEVTLVVEKHRVLQILVNLIQNAINACDEARRASRQIEFRITRPDPDRVRFEIIDNGLGISAENLARLFTHGFTTRKNGHGFGLHSGINSARSMGGTLTAHSDGPGHGAVFTLELPVGPKTPVNSNS